MKILIGIFLEIGKFWLTNFIEINLRYKYINNNSFRKNFLLIIDYIKILYGGVLFLDELEDLVDENKYIII